MAKLGWCMTGFHEGRDLTGPGTSCPGRVENTFTGAVSVCDCECHGGTNAKEPTLPQTDPAPGRREPASLPV